ncbi:hypothetical protein MMU07_02440 [Aquiflexum sp. LQ15W]|uniref:hypothetical protein n=1 Tax=Cognataquiflexum nitidum TaxID=2922272 RepID=UPI001F135280|nr:hypothetical protein [Cognataquiflexum nitidum]MCH6198422.1 hypothetical protein [Cognataquiflexum nitidum]
MPEVMKKVVANLVVFLIFGGMVYLKYRYDLKENRKLIQKINEEYLSISFSDSLNSNVLVLRDPFFGSSFRESSNSVYFQLWDGSKRGVSTSSEIKSNGSISIRNILEPGDLILKSSNSNFISIVKEDSFDTLIFRISK